MAKHTPYLFAATLFLIAAGFGQIDSIRTPAPATPVKIAAAHIQTSAELSERDQALYHGIFQAQKKQDWAAADASISKLGNHLLMGHVLAERYLDRKYHSSPEELADWLAHYADHPQAFAIHALAAKSPALKSSLPDIRKQAALKGYGSDTTLGAPLNSAQSRAWRQGLAAWRTGDKAQAAELFGSIAENDNVSSSWRRSAAAYWAWRAHDALGDKEAAAQYLRIASADTRSFYGILALKQLGQPLQIDAKPDVSENALNDIQREPSASRAAALSRIGENELAERELRQLFPQANTDKKYALLALAHKLGLASVEMIMAHQLGQDDGALDYARYPIPHYEPRGGFSVDPALMYALIRQESGFHASAVSPGGALGLMQLMPQTALFMKRQINAAAHTSTSEPVMNLTLGETYVRHLLDNPSVEGNLFYLLTAYNAGPGRLQEWKDRLNYNDDPLLFVESIPFVETRTYVMQVMTNYWIYSELLGGANRSLYTLSNGRWPSYDLTARPILAIVANAG